VRLEELLMPYSQTLDLVQPGKRLKTKWRAGNYYYEVNVEVDQNKTFLVSFDYNPELLDIFKTSFEGRKWLDNDKKQWAFPPTYRNLFQFERLQGKYAPASPFKRWDSASDLTVIDSTKTMVMEHCNERGLTPYTHQYDMSTHGLLVRWFIWAAEMGTGKTLASIILMEMVKKLFGWDDALWIGPRSALVAAELDFIKWKAQVIPQFVTYDGLKKLMENWPRGKPPFRIVIADEASKLKTPTSKRSVAFKHLSDAMRKEYQDDCFIGLLSGTPAPKAPTDWWHLAESTCPGFLSEANLFHFKNRLAVVVQKEGIPGAGTYPHLETWRDSENKCHHCGKERNHPNHTDDFEAQLGKQKGMTHQKHAFKAMTNEVAKLASRLKGLVTVKLKKDCLDLPDKRYELFRVKPSRAVLNAAKLITQTSHRAIEALTRLRELSDGFQYQDEVIGREVCYVCKGTGKHHEWVTADGSPVTVEEMESKTLLVYDDEGFITYSIPFEPVQQQITCPKCKGEKEIDTVRRHAALVECPKDDILEQLLERNEETGRLNVYAGFQASVDRVVNVCHSKGWCTIRADGRGWVGHNSKGVQISADAKALMKLYDQGDRDEYIAFVGQPGAAGMGLTLTAAHYTFFFSNDFNGENRMQAEDRGHRIGMNVLKGGFIGDVIHLPSDEKVIDNLKLKRDLQHMSMVGVRKAFENAVERSSD
jgi:hypothetical protein